jgi:hypothetical protein
VDQLRPACCNWQDWLLLLLLLLLLLVLLLLLLHLLLLPNHLQYLAGWSTAACCQEDLSAAGCALLCSLPALLVRGHSSCW